MIRLVEQNIEAVRELCRRYRVKRLELFGSGTSGEGFDEAGSDLDFLVEFEPLKEGEYADTYFGLLEAIKELFGRDVDLVMPGAVTNRYFLEAINNSREVLYAA